MARPIKIKINVTKILKDYIFEGKNGKYLNLVAWPNKNGIGKFGDTHFVSQDIPKEARDSGVEAPFVGNLTLPEDEAPRQQAKPSQRTMPPKQTVNDDGLETDEIPF